MDFGKIKQLIELLQESGIAEIEIHEGKESVRIQLGNQLTPVTVPTQTIPVSGPAPAEVAPQKKQHQFLAPMVGTVYLSSTLGAKPFVEVGQMVKAGDVICLIEAMKMFNQIEADKSGKIVARLVENGSSVEYNQPIFIIEQ